MGKLGRRNPLIAVLSLSFGLFLGCSATDDLVPSEEPDGGPVGGMSASGGTGAVGTSGSGGRAVTGGTKATGGSAMSSGTRATGGTKAAGGATMTGAP
jgi:hypothetical protein